MSDLPTHEKKTVCEYCGEKGHDFDRCPSRALYENDVLRELFTKVDKIKKAA